MRSRTALNGTALLNFDEHGGFFDHVSPPECQDDTKLAGPGPHPNLKRLGFRVPAIAMGPFAPQDRDGGAL
jgi:phospholipase C